MANTRHCWICDKEYHYCAKCGKEESWKATACTSNHAQIVQVITEINEKIITKSEAKTMLKNIKIDKNFDFANCGWLPEIIATIKDIVGYVEPTPVKEKIATTKTK